MASDKKRSQLLRELAEHLMSQVPEELLSSSREDLSTSLVRQWQTYDSTATLIFGQEQHYFSLPAVLDTPVRFDLQRVPVGKWFEQCMKYWEFDEEELNKAVRHVNLGQSAIIDNRRGEFLRLWVNPKDRSKGIEKLGPKTESKARKERNLSVLAEKQIDNIFTKIGERERTDLIKSIVRQWTLHDGRALVLTPTAKFHLILEPQDDGKTRITTKRMATGLPKKLCSCGVKTEHLPYFLHLLNLGLKGNITDESGRRCQVVTDPMNANVYFQELPPDMAGNQFNVGM